MLEARFRQRKREMLMLGALPCGFAAAALSSSRALGFFFRASV
jgi:hypothetical protein